VLVTLPLLGLLGCSVNPATGNRQIALISESQEIAMGRDADQQIVAEMGLYPDEEVQAYVQRLGEELAAQSERPNLPWTFRVLDDPVVNAFALPGGYIYVTRGILTHLNSEAELASVLGHEIGHVTARHGVNQMSKQQLFSIGLGVGSILSPELASVADLASTGLQLLFLKYSRDDERQADDLGLRYGGRVGYDLREGPDVFMVLKRVSETAGAGRLPAYMSTHPDPVARSQRMQQKIAATGVDFSGAKVNRNGYLGYLDGMIFGANPREGFFEESGAFLHPEMQFRLNFPQGWKTINQKTVVAGISPAEDAIVQLNLAEQADPVAAAQEFASQEGLEAERVRRSRINGYPAATVQFAVDTQQGRLRGAVSYLRFGDVTFRLLGYSAESKWNSYSRAVGSFIGSFDKLKDRKALNVQPARVEIVDLRRELPLETFNSQYPSSVPIDTLALINHVDSGGTLRAEGAKRVIGGPGQ
jgi:predicted Zn-dependent protease